MEYSLLRELAEGSLTKEELLQAVERDFQLLPVVIDGVSSSKARVRYGCAKVLMDLSARHPEKLNPRMDSFVSLLDSKYRVLVWNALAIIANLCKADKDRKFDAIFDRYYGFLNDEYMVTVANVVGNSARIARAKPYLVPRITAELLRVDEISISPHLTEECKRVIAEKAIESFNQFFDLMSEKEKKNVFSFVKKHADSSTRVSLSKQAELFLRNQKL